jgi:beta-glucanase (GH16 family)
MHSAAYDPPMRVSLVLTLAVASLALQSAPPAAPPATLFFDDFSGPALDPSRWTPVVTGRTVNNEQQAYIDSPDVFAFLEGDAEGATNGALIIRPRFREGFETPQGRRFDFVSGRADTKGKFEFTHGTVSARIKLTVGAGLWPAFWLLGTGQWPATGEIDIMEHAGEAAWTSVAIHGPGYSGNTPLVSRARADPAQGVESWHVYAVEWTAQSMIFSVDSHEVYRATRETIERYGPWAFDNPKYVILNLAVGGAFPRSVNHVEGPYPGLSPTAIDLIKRDQARFVVDWVKVVARPAPQ